MTALFSSSSFLPNSNIFWKKIRNEVNSIEFSEYGNIVNSLLSVNEFDSLITTVFFEDIYNSDSNNGINLILNALEQSMNFNKPIFFSIAHNSCNNYISCVRYQNEEQIQYNYFKESLYKISSKYNNLFIIDLEKLFNLHGNKNIYDKRNWYFSHMRVSNEGLELIDLIISNVIKRSFAACKKVLILDCDNTLWGGVIGEDNLTGISIGGDGLGHAFKDFQIAAKSLKENGTLLALASKNEEEDVWDVFNNHNEMILKKDDIVLAKINWIEKSQNIKELADDLGLGLDSFVFWDDNPIEREKVKKSLPEVTVIDVPKEIYKWPDILLNLIEFSKFQVTEEDLFKSDQYKSRAEFNRNKKNINFDQKDFLKKINLKPSIAVVDHSSLSRAAQLTQKTNQFNLRTKRYSEIELQKIVNNKDYKCLISSAVDDFGDHGQIALSIIKYDHANKIAFLDTFLLSCRILGRDIELWLLQSILNDLNKAEIQILEIEYIKTERNKLVKDFLTKCDSNFKKLKSDNDSVKFRIATEKQIINTKEMY